MKEQQDHETMASAREGNRESGNEAEGGTTGAAEGKADRPGRDINPRERDTKDQTTERNPENTPELDALESDATGSRTNGNLTDKATGAGSGANSLEEKAVGVQEDMSMTTFELGGGAKLIGDNKPQKEPWTLEVGILDLNSSFEHPEYMKIKITVDEISIKFEGEGVEALKYGFEKASQVMSVDFWDKFLFEKVPFKEMLKEAFGISYDLVKMPETDTSTDRVDYDYWKKESDFNYSRGLVDWPFGRTERLIRNDRSNLPDFRTPGQTFK